MAKMLNNERFYWLRIIKKYKRHFEGFEEYWKETMNKIPINAVRELSDTMQQLFKFSALKYWKVTPLHIAAFEGNFQLCQYIFTKMKDKELHGNAKLELIPPKTFWMSYQNSPLHFAAAQGNVEICRLILGKPNF